MTRTSQPQTARRTGAARQWLAFADRLLAVSPVGLRLPEQRAHHSPGREGGYGTAVDGLEGFARTFLLAGFRIAGERGEGVDDLIDFYARGIATGVDPAAPDRWVRLDEHAQAKVEAASIALILDLTRPWIWDRLDALDAGARHRLPRARRRRRHLPAQTNWVWFRLVVQTFLRSVGGPWSLARHGRRPRHRTTPSSAPTAGCPTAPSGPTTTTSAGPCTSTRCCGRGWPAPPTSPATARAARRRSASTGSCSTPLTLVGARRLAAASRAAA